MLSNLFLVLADSARLIYRTYIFRTNICENTMFILQNDSLQYFNNNAF